jgi:hypothetical protein
MRVHQRKKFLRFIACEAVAVIILFASITVGVGERHRHLSISEGQAAPKINPIVTTLTICAAVALGIIPVIFYGLPPTLPRDGSA